MVKLVLLILSIVLVAVLMLIAYAGMVFKNREFMRAYSWMNGSVD
jgi:hypothetical protein